ncbi:hypothetical protein OSB04_001868 [Centaurea solstitialis]|uniref:Uncharacterized protein n=1 Tax=Centaurea solstitialis TaxID=347529 RepID=A0AA38U9X1_9ASTR|nr:hypothetical protein OSB04_001868 [Centaurea solstitialis]
MVAVVQGGGGDGLKEGREKGRPRGERKLKEEGERSFLGFNQWRRCFQTGFRVYSDEKRELDGSFKTSDVIGFQMIDYAQPFSRVWITR